MSDRVQKRYTDILAAGMRLAERVGLDNLRRDAVATEAGRSFAAVNNAFGTLDKLKEKIVDNAISGAQSLEGSFPEEHHQCLVILGKALASGNERARTAPADVKERALAALV